MNYVKQRQLSYRRLKAITSEAYLGINAMCCVIKKKCYSLHFTFQLEMQVLSHTISSFFSCQVPCQYFAQEVINVFSM